MFPQYDKMCALPHLTLEVDMIASSKPPTLEDKIQYSNKHRL